VVYTNEPRRYGNLISQRRGSTSHWYQFDAIGSTRELTNSTAVVTDTRLYDAWGLQVLTTGVTSFPFKYCGRIGYVADAIGLHNYVRARYYSFGSGRWVSADPMGFGDSLNRFGYARMRPMRFVDPSGLHCTSGLYWVKYSRGNDELPADPENPAPEETNYQTAEICVELELDNQCRLVRHRFGLSCFTFSWVDCVGSIKVTLHYTAVNKAPPPIPTPERKFPFIPGAGDMYSQNSSLSAPGCGPVGGTPLILTPVVPGRSGAGDSLSGSIALCDWPCETSRGYGYALVMHDEGIVGHREQEILWDFATRDCGRIDGCVMLSVLHLQKEGRRGEDVLRLLSRGAGICPTEEVQPPHPPRPPM
jgi:RHS repeat-associated protein